MAINNDKFLWHEICDNFEEKFSFLMNEIDHYNYIFQQNNVVTLLNITSNFKSELL